MDDIEIKRENRVKKTLTAIFKTLVEDHGMEPDYVGSLMVEAGHAVAGKNGDVYLYVVIGEIEKRTGISILTMARKSNQVTPTKCYRDGSENDVSQYQVIIGDKSMKTATAEELAELEKA